MSKSVRSRLKEYWEEHLKHPVTVTTFFVFLPLLLVLHLISIVFSKRHLALPYARRVCSNAIGRYRVLYRRLPVSNPILLAEPDLHSDVSQPDGPSSVPGFHRLSSDIRQRIYRYLLPPAGLIIQPELKGSKIGVRRGLLPRIGRRGDIRYKSIRDDSDAPSDALRNALARGAWYLNQSGIPLVPDTSTTSTSTSTTRNTRSSSRTNNPDFGDLMCGHGDAIPPDHHYHTELLTRTTTHLNLMRVNRQFYTDLHDALYATHTFSFFGPEMLTFFTNNASPQGLRRIRSVHFALPVDPTTGLRARRSRRRIVDGMRALPFTFPALRALDLEIVLLWNVPDDSVEFWTWLCDDVLGPLKSCGLDAFTMRVWVLKREYRHTVSGGELGAVFRKFWVDVDYEGLKGGIVVRKDWCDEAGAETRTGTGSDVRSGSGGVGGRVCFRGEEPGWLHPLRVEPLAGLSCRPRGKRRWWKKETEENVHREVSALKMEQPIPLGPVASWGPI